ncbi:MAG: hypothetical protein J5496_07975 [Lachnospiraceae bacterium]|nr:hypothetical protein [Lachnospiraceae bacterium]
MLLTNALKTVCDFLLFFSLAGLIGSYGEAGPLVGSVLILAFFSSLILQKAGGTLPARILCGLLPALGLLAAKDRSELWITAVILLAYFALTLAGKNNIHYDNYKYWFGLPAIGIALLFAVCLVRWPAHRMTVLCCGAYLFLGVFVLRSKRIGKGLRAGIALMNLAEMTAVVVFGSVFFYLLYALFMRSGDLLLTLLSPIAYLWALLTDFLVRFWRVLEEDPSETTTAAVTEESTAEEAAADPNAAADPAEPAPNYAWVAPLVKVVLILLVLAFLVWIIFRIVRGIRRLRTEEEKDGDPYELGTKRDSLPAGRTKRRKKNTKTGGSSNKQKIRTVYWQYLNMVRAHGTEIGGQMTSEEVLTASAWQTDSEAAARLRELYILARYDGEDQVSDGEVEEAEALLSRIRERYESAGQS